MNKRIISIDAETNGLWGRAFMIAGVAYDDGREVSRFVGRCPIDGEVNSWVAENVLPQLKQVPVTHADYDELLKAFIDWHQQFPQWNSWDRQDGYQTLWHMGHVVEVALFRHARERLYIGDFDAPYVPIELATLLQSRGFRPDSVDEYIKTHNLPTPDVDGGTHNALYDAIAAATVYFDLVK